MKKEQYNYRNPALWLCLIFASILFSCSSSKPVNNTNYHFKNARGIPDYASLNYWASHPWKADPADEVPAGVTDKNKDSLVDVFFIHPTSYTSSERPMGWNADIDNEAVNKKTDEGTILYQASVFNQHARIFAPRYRQAHLDAFYTADKNSSEKAFDLAYEDIKTAFEYYLKNYNHNRPIIIASHSQGTLHAGRLLKEFFEGKALQKKMVAAYIIGLPVFKNYFTALTPCTDPAATGCFVSWRTFKEGYVPEFVKKEKNEAYVINPLTWKADETLASSGLNKGGILRDFNKVIPALVHAQVHANVLWANKPRFFGSIFVTMKNYHIIDYNLFYMNIRENVETRVRAYLDK